MVVGGGRVMITDGGGTYKVHIDIQGQAITVDDIKDALRGLYGNAFDQLLDEKDVDDELASGEPFVFGQIPPKP